MGSNKETGHCQIKNVHGISEILSAGEFKFEAQGFDVKSVSLKIKLIIVQDISHILYVLIILVFLAVHTLACQKKGYLYLKSIFTNDFVFL